jgi:hypothetical protein
MDVPIVTAATCVRDFLEAKRYGDETVMNLCIHMLSTAEIVDDISSLSAEDWCHIIWDGGDSCALWNNLLCWASESPANAELLPFILEQSPANCFVVTSENCVELLLIWVPLAFEQVLKSCAHHLAYNELGPGSLARLSAEHWMDVVSRKIITPLLLQNILVWAEQKPKERQHLSDILEHAQFRGCPVDTQNCVQAFLVGFELGINQLVEDSRGVLSSLQVEHNLDWLQSEHWENIVRDKFVTRSLLVNMLKWVRMEPGRVESLPAILEQAASVTLSRWLSKDDLRLLQMFDVGIEDESQDSIDDTDMDTEFEDSDFGWDTDFE